MAAMAHELRPYGVAIVSLRPGRVKAEKTLAQRDRLPPKVLAHGEAPQCTGRAVAALAAAPKVMDKMG
jgi:dehydrogenase/reductase SDR family member 1